MLKLLFKIKADKMRKEWAKNDAIRDKDNVLPESVEVIKDISYGRHGKWNLLDVNRPKSYNGKLPCIVSFHGGGWFYGDKELYRFYAADLAARGFAVINFNYRLCPENAFPSHIEDCNAALTWLCNNAAGFDIDLNRLFFVGDSAGANLVYHYSTLLTNPDFAKLYDFEVPQIKPKAVGLNCGTYNLDKQIKDDMILKAYIQNQKKYAEHIKVQKYVNENFPAVYIMSAPNDFLRAEVEPMIEFFKAKNIPVTSKIYGTKEDPDACHVFHVNLKLAIAKECNDDECNYFKSFC